MMEFQHWPWAIKFCLNKMTGVLGKIIKVIVEMLKTLKNQLMKNPNNWRRFSPQLLGSIEKADVAIRVGQKKLLECFSQIILQN